MATAETHRPVDNQVVAVVGDAVLSYASAETRMITVITPPGEWGALNLSEVWRYRDLLLLLVWRDISARYRQSIVGYGWAILKPSLSVLIFTMVFGKMMKVESDGQPYVLFALSALIPWTYFSAALSGVSSSVVSNSNLLTKVYFPRLILPLSCLGAGLADLLLQLGLLFGIMAWYHIVPGWQFVALPFFVAITVMASLAFGLWLAVLNVRYRDVGHAVPFLLQAWMWLSPEVYSSTIVSARWRWLYYANPMVGVIDGFRWCVLGTELPDLAGLGQSLALVCVMLVTGLFYFRTQESTFADVI